MNNLQNSLSPYLQQHKNNPVHWNEWSEKTIQKAKNENKMIFLSIGYSSCHWCHVMEHESFENEEVAEILNKNFISIKVDREERPDLDKYYQNVFVLFNNRAGGWPLSIFMTPELKVFYTATYIPPAKKYNMMGIKDILNIIVEKYKTEKDRMIESGDSIISHMNNQSSLDIEVKLDSSIINKFVSYSYQSFEKEYGGFSHKPKFPHTSTMKTLLEIYRLKKDEKALQMVEFTLKNMAKGGIRDLVDGGFSRYSVDEKWLVPHFEKMTYDNALLSEIYLETYFITKDKFYFEIAKETIDFMLEFMSEDNLFYSASDADSDGEEGKYFVYDYDEVKEEFEKNSINLELLEILNITKDGNFEGKNIVRLEENRDIQDALKVLKNIRKKRNYPFIDKKIITSLNSMMIKSLFSISYEEEKYMQVALNSLEKLIETMILENTLYHSCLIHNRPNVEAFLEDYAYLIDCLIMAYQRTFDDKYINLAITLNKESNEKYFDENGWYFSKGEFEVKADGYDNSYPSSLSIMVHNNLTLSHFEDFEFLEVAKKSLALYSNKLNKYPFHLPNLTLAVIRDIFDDKLVKSKEVEKNIKFINEFSTFNMKHSDENYLLCGRFNCFKTSDSLNDLFV
jgi:uncharacterized protein YyaL (SSP411 family)